MEIIIPGTFPLHCIMGNLFSDGLTYFSLEFRLPGFFLCSSVVPSTAYSSLSENDTLLILNELTKFCNGTEDTEVSALN